MRNAFFISDQHYGHSNMLEFFGDEAKTVKVRPQFSNVEEMDEEMVKRHNSVVGPKDRIYFLGDVCISRKAIHRVLPRLNGRKVLLKGNHDIFPLKDYTPYFEDIRAYKIYPEQGIICSHIPIHTSNLERRFKINIHGHLHTNFVKKEFYVKRFQDGKWVDETPNDPRYINVCVENINYTPISLEEILNKIKLDK